jgi:hypothetical protein
VTPAEDEALIALSRILFGQRHRLAVMIAVARSSSGVVNPGDLAAELGFRAQSSIQDPLRDLCAAGLLARLPDTSGRTYYERQESKVWAWIEDLNREHQRAASEVG